MGRLPGRGRAEKLWLLELAGSGVLGTGALAYLWVTDPATRPWSVGLVALFVVFFGTFLNLDTWLDPTRGRLRHRRAGVAHWQVSWAQATEVRLRSNHAGLVLLQVRGSGWRAIRVPVVAVDRRGPRSQPLAVMWLLADEIRRWAPARHHPVADELDTQADHLERTGRVRDSPLILGYTR